MHRHICSMYKQASKQSFLQSRRVVSGKPRKMEDVPGSTLDQACVQHTLKV